MPHLNEPIKPQFDKEKYVELLVYVASKTEGKPKFGDTHLNKVLAYADWFAYGKFGKAMTGQRINRIQRGPTSRPLVPARKELVDDGVLTVREVETAFGWKRRKTQANRAPDLSKFSAEEIALVDELVDEFAPMTATQLSKWTHGVVWDALEHLDDVPYEAVFFTRHSLSNEEAAYGRELEKSIGG